MCHRKERGLCCLSVELKPSEEEDRFYFGKSFAFHLPPPLGFQLAQDDTGCLTIRHFNAEEATFPRLPLSAFYFSLCVYGVFDRCKTFIHYNLRRRDCELTIIWNAADRAGLPWGGTRMSIYWGHYHLMGFYSFITSRFSTVSETSKMLAGWRHKHYH